MEITIRTRIGEGFFTVELTVEFTVEIDIFLRKAVKWGYAQKVTSLSELLRNADEKLFSKMRSSNYSIFYPSTVAPG